MPQNGSQVIASRLGRSLGRLPFEHAMTKVSGMRLLVQAGRTRPASINAMTRHTMLTVQPQMRCSSFSLETGPAARTNRSKSISPATEGGTFGTSGVPKSCSTTKAESALARSALTDRDRAKVNAYTPLGSNERIGESHPPVKHTTSKPANNGVKDNRINEVS